MAWLLIGVLLWVALAVGLALLIGRGIRLADLRRARPPTDEPAANFIAGEAGTGEPTAEKTPPARPEPWSGPSTVPFATSRPPWGGDRTSPRQPPPVHRPVPAPSPDPRAARDSDRA